MSTDERYSAELMKCHRDLTSEADQNESRASTILSVVNSPQHWRELASEARAKAQDMTDPEAKLVMFKVAEQYERFVKLAERLRE